MDDTHYRIEKQKQAIRAILSCVPANRRTGVLHSLRSDTLKRLQYGTAQTEQERKEGKYFVERLYENCDLFNQTDAGRRLKARRKNWFLVWWVCTLVFAAQVYLSPLPSFHWMNHPAWQAVVIPLIPATYLTMLVSVVWDNQQGKKLKRQEINQMQSAPSELPQIVMHAVDELLEEHYQA